MVKDNATYHRTEQLPAWVPIAARRYLAHTTAGQSIRDLARGADCHASTVLRQIRRVEAKRDDPLVDKALEALALIHPSARALWSGDNQHGMPTGREFALSVAKINAKSSPPDAQTLAREATRVLRRMCETGAVLAVATEMEKAVVVRDAANGLSTRTAVVDREIAEAMALKEWIHCDAPGRISRYRITSGGRSALNALLADAENKRRSTRDNGFEESQTAFDHEAGAERRGSSTRFAIADSPLAALARRRDKDGQPFLADDLVRAGERLREDFELSQLDGHAKQNWDGFLTAGISKSVGPTGPSNSADAARARVEAALTDLGPGLSDVALRCCCHLQGLETAEKKLGWSARSGKIVLRIALQRLKRHYASLSDAANMIG